MSAGTLIGEMFPGRGHGDLTPEELRAYRAEVNRRWRRRNPGSAAESNRLWRERHPGRAAESERRRSR